MGEHACLKVCPLHVYSSHCFEVEMREEIGDGRSGHYNQSLLFLSSPWQNPPSSTATSVCSSMQPYNTSSFVMVVSALILANCLADVYLCGQSSSQQLGCKTHSLLSRREHVTLPRDVPLSDIL